jgi:hypothetical protein
MTNLPGVLMYGSLPLRRQFWMVPTEQFKRRESSSVSMNPSGSDCGPGPEGSANVATACVFIVAILRPHVETAKELKRNYSVVVSPDFFLFTDLSLTGTSE